MAMRTLLRKDYLQCWSNPKAGWNQLLRTLTTGRGTPAVVFAPEKGAARMATQHRQSENSSRGAEQVAGKSLGGPAG